MHFRRLPPIPNTLRQFSLTLTRRHSSQLRSLHRVMSSSSSSLSSSDLARKWLTPAFLDDVHEHWFTGYSPNDPLPSQEWWQRCFMKSEENDRFCRLVFFLKIHISLVSYVRRAYVFFLHPWEVFDHWRVQYPLFSMGMFLISFCANIVLFLHFYFV